MPDRRRNRSAAPADAELFSPAALPSLRAAASDLAWLLSRGYPERGARKLVGDRYGLRKRQREALSRAVCSDADRAERASRRVERDRLAGEPAVLDGFNLLTTVESALGGGVVLFARDGCARDLASLHGTWRRVNQTPRALELIGEALLEARVGPVRWILDAPVSNSGRLAALLREHARSAGIPWTVETAPDADAALIADGAVVVSADRAVLGRCGRWWSLAREIVQRRVPGAWVVDLGG